MNERNLQLAEDFTNNGWRNTPHSQLKDEVKSFFKETNRLIDTWPYYFDDGGIFVKIKNKDNDEYKKTYVDSLISRKGYPESIEANIFDELGDWIRETDEGFALWISPSYPGKLLCSKVIIHEIYHEPGSTEKIVLNSSLPFEASKEKIVQMLHSLFPETTHIKNLEEFRSILLKFGADFDPNLILSEIAKLDKNVLNARTNLTAAQIESGTTYISDIIIAGADSRFIAYEMQRLGLVGQFSISCPPSNGMFSELGTGMRDRYGSLEFTCPNCRATNTRPYGQLISNCQHCGGSVRC